jgi:rRNA maturation protein Nop10
MNVTFGGKAEPDCPVCGSKRVVTRGCIVRECLWLGIAHLHRHCRACGYYWLEELYDARGSEAAVDHPQYYGGADDPYEAIKVIEAWGLGFHLGNVLKYIRRAGEKDSTPEGALSDLRKARWYLDRYIEIVDQKVME